jgi:hypothetical protein
MGWLASSSDISAADLAFAADDKPILAGINALESPQLVKWAATANGTDITVAGYPTSRAYDRLGHLRTKSTAGTERWFHMQLNASPADFDGVLIWGTEGLDGLTVAVWIADTADATGGVGVAEEIATTTASGTERIAFLDLQHSAASVAQRYSSVPYLFLKITGASFTPEIGEVWLIRRRQMSHFPRLSWDPNNYGVDQVTKKSRSGVGVNYVNHSGRQDLVASFNPSLTADQDNFKSLIADTGYGTKPFVFIDDPNSEPEKFRVIQPPADPGLGFPFVGWTERQITISGLENYPFQTTDVP